MDNVQGGGGVVLASGLRRHRIRKFGIRLLSGRVSSRRLRGVVESREFYFWRVLPFKNRSAEKEGKIFTKTRRRNGGKRLPTAISFDNRSRNSFSVP